MDCKTCLVLLSISCSVYSKDEGFTWNEPADVIGSGEEFSVNLDIYENQATNTPIAQFTATSDKDISSYTLVKDEDIFTLVSEHLRITSALDFENTTEYVLIIQVVDGEKNTARLTINVTVINVNETPVMSETLIPVSVQNNAPPGTVIASVSATDPDANDMITYSLNGGNTGNMFRMDGLDIVVSTGKKINATETPGYSLTIRASDKDGLNDDAEVIVIVQSCPNAGTTSSAVGYIGKLLITIWAMFILRNI